MTLKVSNLEGNDGQELQSSPSLFSCNKNWPASHFSAHPPKHSSANHTHTHPTYLWIFLTETNSSPSICLVFLISHLENLVIIHSSYPFLKMRARFSPKQRPKPINTAMRDDPRFNQRLSEIVNSKLRYEQRSVFAIDYTQDAEFAALASCRTNGSA